MASDSTTAAAAATATAPTPDWPLTIAEADDWDLSYMNCSLSTSNLRDGLRAVVSAGDIYEVKTKEINVWEYLSKYSPPADRGFMFSAGEDNIVTHVQTQMIVGHSGYSMGWTMRQIEYIAKNGLAKHRDIFMTNHATSASP